MKKLLFLLLVCVLLAVPGSDQVYAAMAHNIYIDPDLSQTSGEYKAFVIDFYGEKTPLQTYWAMCNWNMKGGFGAYAGFQNTVYGKNTILSFWEGNVNGKMITAQRMYPSGQEDSFGGEGTGTHWLQSYNWSSKAWYRMLIYCWKDAQTKKTFVGQWVSKVGTGKWKLMSYFNTKLNDSCMVGDLSQFQENFDGGYSSAKRKFRIKNMYTLDNCTNQWVPLNTATLTYDLPGWGFDTAGTHTFGAKNGYFWGEAGGSVSNQADYDSNAPEYLTKTISQPQNPSLGKVSVVSLSAKKKSSSKLTVSWKLGSTSTPIYQYKIDILNNNGKVIYSKTISRPEKRSVTISQKVKSGYKVKLTAFGVNGKKVVKTKRL